MTKEGLAPFSDDFAQEILARGYTTSQATTVLGISRMTLWRWVKSGKLDIYHIGRQPMLDKQQVEALMKYATRSI